MREYTEQHYFPAAANYLERAADKGATGARVVKWQQTLDEKWAALRFGEMKVETRGGQHVFDVQVYLADDERYLPWLTDPTLSAGMNVELEHK